MKSLLSSFLLWLIVHSVSAQQNYFNGQAIAMLKRGANFEVFSRNFNDTYPGINLSSLQCLSRRTNTYLVGFDSAAISTPALVKLLKEQPDVLLAQPNHTNVSLRITEPTDPDYPAQYQMKGLSSPFPQMPFAWDMATAPVTKAGDTIVIAIVDGGVDIQHNDLNIWVNPHEIPGNGIDDDNNGYIDDVNGWNAYGNNGTVPSDPHGTHVAGISGAIANNNFGVAGMLWGAKILPVAGGSGNEATVVAAYGYVLEMRARYNESHGDSGAYIVASNSSFGVNFADPADYPVWCAFYDSLGNYGILNACATSNSSMNVDTQGDVPTTCPSEYVVAVTNIDSSENLLGGYGAINIDLAAIGWKIYSTTPNQQFGYQTGTSMASPHIAGAIGVLYSYICTDTLAAFDGKPDSLARWIKTALTAVSSTNQLSSLNGKTVSGGSLNVFKALLHLHNNNCMNSGITESEDYCNECKGTVSVTVSGDRPPYTVSLATLTDTVTGPLNYDSLCPGPYVVIIEDSSGYRWYENIEIEADIPITISKTIIPATSPTSNDGRIELSVSGGFPGYHYTWSTGDTTSFIENVPAGNYWVEVTDDHTCSTSDTIYLYIVGIEEEYDSSEQVNVYPVPSKGYFFVSLNDNFHKPVAYELTDITGRQLQRGVLTPGAQNRIAVTGLGPGTYLLLIGQRIVRRVVIHKIAYF